MGNGQWAMGALKASLRVLFAISLVLMCSARADAQVRTADPIARGLQLSCGERLFCGMQQGMEAVPPRDRFVPCGFRLVEPAFLGRQQRSFEAPRQNRRANREFQRLPAGQQFRAVDGRPRGSALGLEDKRLRAGERLVLLLA